MTMNRSNHQGIAKAIYNLEHDWKAMRDFRKSDDDYVLLPNITISKSEDAMVWYVWFSCNEQDNPYVKVVPAFNYDVHTIEAILKAQSWHFL